MEETSQRIIWVDNIKAFCMLLVYVYHCSIFTNYDASSWMYFIYPFFTNSFFFVSGYLIFKKQFKPEQISLSLRKYLDWGGVKFVQNILYKIVLPTLLFSIILFVPKIIIRGERFEMPVFLHDTILGGSLWFTCSLAVAEVIIWGLLLTRSKSLLFYVAATLIISVISVYMVKNDMFVLGEMNIPWFYNTGMIASLFLVTGGMWSVFEKHLKKLISSWFFIIITAIFYAIIVYLDRKNTCYLSYDINECKVNALGYIFSVLSIIWVLAICCKISSSSIVKWYGRNTLGLYFLSGGVPSVIAVILNKLNFGPSLVGYIICVIVSVLISTFLVWLLIKYMPFLFDLRLLRTEHKK